MRFIIYVFIIGIQNMYRARALMFYGNFWGCEICDHSQLLAQIFLPCSLHPAVKPVLLISVTLHLSEHNLCQEPYPSKFGLFSQLGGVSVLPLPTTRSKNRCSLSFSRSTYPQCCRKILCISPEYQSTIDLRLDCLMSFFIHSLFSQSHTELATPLYFPKFQFSNSITNLFVILYIYYCTFKMQFLYMFFNPIFTPTIKISSWFPS